MSRALLVAAVAAISMFSITGVVLASDPPADPVVPPAFVPPTPSPVVDTDSAAAFAEDFASDNAGRFVGQRRHRERVRVVDANAACLQSPILATRFGCVFTLRVLVISGRNHGWDNWGHSAHKSSKRGHHGRDHRRHFRIRNYGCLGFLRINGGPTVTPTAEPLGVECARIPRGDLVAPEPVI